MSQAGVLNNAPGPGTDVESVTTDDSNSVTPDGMGAITFTGSVVANATNTDAPLFTDGATANTVDYEIQVATSISETAGDPFDAGLVSFYSAEFDVDADGFAQLSDRVRRVYGRVENLGFEYNAGTGVFTIKGGDGNDLSNTNPAYICLKSAADSEILVVHKLTANQSFTDAAGSSDITGNLFGTLTGESWGALDIPFYVHAVPNDDDSEIVFMIARVIQDQSPSTANIGAPDDAVADVQGAFWAFSNIDETLFDTNPCLCVGSIRARKDAMDDWTLRPLEVASDGPGQYNEYTTFLFPAGVNGASSGSYMTANGGTAPVFNDQDYVYRMRRNGMVECLIAFDGDGGTDGAGAVSAQIVLPLRPSNNSGAGNTYQFHGGRVDGSGINDGHALFSNTINSDVVIMHEDATPGFIQNADFGSGGRFIFSTFYYWVEDDA